MRKSNQLGKYLLFYGPIILSCTSEAPISFKGVKYGENISEALVGRSFGNISTVEKDIIAVLKNEAASSDLPVLQAWRIDSIKMKFIRIPGEGLRCSRSGILKEDQN